MCPLNSQQLQQLKRQLLKEKKELNARFHANEHLGLAESQRGQTGELSMYDNHPADTATEIYERGKDIALNEHAELQLQEIDQALHRIKTDRYGKCITCGKEIPYERLEAVPTTLYCKAHAPEQHVSLRRPAEEEFLQPPFGRTSMDDEDSGAFDGEDAWQIVESWGNSDSPAMAEEPDVNDYNGLYIEASEPEGYVEPIENFLASDLYGQPYEHIIRSKEYQQYMKLEEGETELAFLQEDDPTNFY